MKMYQNRIFKGGNPIQCCPNNIQVKKCIQKALSKLIDCNPKYYSMRFYKIYDVTNHWIFVMKLNYDQWGTFVIDTTINEYYGPTFNLRKTIYHKVFPVSEFSPSLAYKYGRESNRKGMIK